MDKCFDATVRLRGGLPNTLAALARGNLTVGYIGGSITDARVEHNWPEFVTSWLVDRYPDVRIFVENAAIGGTGSDLGLFRAERDLINRDCDLVFVEYAVNDVGIPSEIRMKSREGLLRKLLGSKTTDVVLVYTYMHEMFPVMHEGGTPETIRELEQLAIHYNLNSVWMGKHAFELCRRGMLRYDQWLPDNLHPQAFGSQIYAEAVTAMLQEKLKEENGGVLGTLPNALDLENWENAQLADLDQAEFSGPWHAYRSHTLVWADRIYSSVSIGSRMKLKFMGRGAYLITNFGQKSADYRISVDGQPWQPSEQDYPSWCSDIGWMRAQKLVYPLDYGDHVLEIELILADKPAPTGNRFDLIGIGIV